MIWLLIGYMWLFIHRPFEVWPVLATVRVERMYMIFAIVCWLASGPAIPRGNRLHRYFVGFILVMIASWLLSPYQAGEKTVEDYLKYAVFYVLVVTSVRNGQDLRRILVGFVCIMALLMAHSLREYFCGNVWYAQGIMRMKSLGSTFGDYNDFAGLVVCSLPFAWVLWHEWTARWKRAMLLGYFGMSGYCVVLTASRMGICGLVVAGLLWSLASPKRWRLLALCALLLAAAWTVLPEKHKNRYLTIVDPSYGPATAATSAGHWRFGGFEKGLGLFQERPLFGFGPQSTGQVTGTGMMPHNLYGQLLGELGVFGAIAFSLIVLGVVQNTLEARRIARGQSAAGDTLPWRMVVAASAAFLLLLFMGWGFNFLFWHVWLWFGAFQVIALHCLRAEAYGALPNELMPMPIGNKGLEVT